MTKILVAGVLAALGFIPAKGQNWYKGNLHTHSLWSDGDDYPEMIADWYKSHGYNFLGISDHNKLQEGNAWKKPATDPEFKAFHQYLGRFGSLVDYFNWSKPETIIRVKTMEEYRGLFEENGKFILFQSEEVTSNLYTHPIHMVATNIKYVISPQYAKTITGVVQKTVDKVREQRRETGIRMIVQLNHPNFGYAITAEDIIPVKNLRFFEVFNGAPATNNYGNQVNDSTEVIWDKVNLHRVKENEPLLLGLGVDDAHHYHQFNSDLNNPGRAWIMVNAPRLDQESIVESMEAGKFYASTGVVLENLSFDSETISLRVKKEAGVSYEIWFIGVREGKDHAEVIKKVKGTEAKYEIGSRDLFVRAKIISSRLKENPFRKGDFETAWTQPVTRRGK